MLEAKCTCARFPTLFRNVSFGSDLTSGRVKDIWLILLSGDINLVDACDLASLLPEKPDGDILVKLLDMLLPFAVVQRLAHGLALLAMERTVSRKHEVQSSLAEEETSSLSPGDTEVLGVFQDSLCSHVRGDVYTRRNKGRPVPGEVVMSTEISHDLLHLAWDSHWEMSVDRIALDMVRECPEHELVEHAALVDTEVIVSLSVTPVGQVLRMVINLSHRI